MKNVKSWPKSNFDCRKKILVGSILETLLEIICIVYGATSVAEMTHTAINIIHTGPNIIPVKAHYNLFRIVMEQ